MTKEVAPGRPGQKGLKARWELEVGYNGKGWIRENCGLWGLFLGLLIAWQLSFLTYKTGQLAAPTS